MPMLQHAPQSSLSSTQGHHTAMLHHHSGQSGQGQSQVHSVRLGPPPLISVVEQNVNPFYLKKLTGNIRVCQGCRGSLRLADGSIPNPPNDLVVARLERRQFRDSSGTLKTPSRASAAHYHARLACVRAGDPSFIASSLLIPADVGTVLTAQHQELLLLEFGLQICVPPY